MFDIDFGLAAAERQRENDLPHKKTLYQCFFVCPCGSYCQIKHFHLPVLFLLRHCYDRLMLQMAQIVPLCSTSTSADVFSTHDAAGL